MPQRHHVQHGTFHVTTNTRDKVPWCTKKGVPELLIDNLVMTRNLQNAKLYAFCILPTHIHLLIAPGDKGLSAFVQSFKSNSAKDILELPELRRCVAAQRSGIAAPGNTHQIWQKSFFEERIKNARQYSAATHYIQGNAMKHGLVKEIIDWPWASLHFKNLLDTMELWL